VDFLSLLRIKTLSCCGCGSFCLTVFVSDATVTLIRRLLRKQKPHVAHRSHAYQHLAIRLNSHAKVALLVLAVNIAWLLPIAFLVADKQLAGTTGVIIAYVPLLVLQHLRLALEKIQRLTNSR
jgi:Fuc2NAc and GlcNAc transferase